MVLPSETTLPGTGYLLALGIVVPTVGYALYRIEPEITDRTMVAFTPWMAVGSSCYVLSRFAGIPNIVSPLLTSPTVYVSTATVAGIVWAGANTLDFPTEERRRRVVPEVVGAIGCIVAIFFGTLALYFGMVTAGGLAPTWPLIGLIITVALSAMVWIVLRRSRPRVRVTGGIGVLCVFSHTLDGVSTAIGLDLLGYGEQTPFSQFIFEIGAELPTASTIGSGWLFIVIKVTLACIVVVLLNGYVRDEPAEGYLLLAGITAVGLGPGLHNLLLFTVNL